MADSETTPLSPIVAPGRNCWRVETASRATVIVDAALYYHCVREAFEKARKRLLIIGWDFDTRVPLEPAGQPGARPESLGKLFLRLARENPDRAIDVLKWSFGALKQFLRPSATWMLLRWHFSRPIDFRFDSAHPVGCSHHQKIVVIDDALAVCGGIDIAGGRWDTPEHIDDDPRRALPNGSIAGPWHDVTMMMTGPIAQALGELGRKRWSVATREQLEPVAQTELRLWPDDLAVDFEDVQIAVARTRAPYREQRELREVENLFLDMIAEAKRHIYIENQYFTSPKIAAAIAARMEQPEPPEVVLVMPRQADGWLEQMAMDAARVRLARAIGKVDPENRFRIYVPHTTGGKDIYVHAKVSIIDDRLLRVGSANLNNRSLGLDSECDVVIDAGLPGNANTAPGIAAVRNALIAEHLGVTPAEFAAKMEELGSMVAAIEALRGEGKTLELLDLIKPGPFDKFIADNELLDPESADGFFEPLSKRGLWRRWHRSKTWARLRERGRSWRQRTRPA